MDGGVCDGFVVRRVLGVLLQRVVREVLQLMGHAVVRHVSDLHEVLAGERHQDVVLVVAAVRLL